MRVEMTKAAVIAAIKAERLTAGAWARYPDDAGGKPATKACSFCAVGSVIRASMATTTPVEVIEYAAEDEGDWNAQLSALSNAFEEAAWREWTTPDPEALEAGRRAAIAHVRKHFPPRIVIDIGDAKPRRGMRVVP